MNYWLIFLTGLTTGGLSCAAIQGGLLAATLAGREHEPGPHESLPNALHDVKPTLLFLSSKLIAHIFLGALLGFFGSYVQLTSQVRGYFQIATGIYMIGLALHLLEIHPIFRYFVLQPPKWAGKLLRSQSKSNHFFAPAIVGFLTILIPCGVTQGMEVLAISSGNPWTGAIILGSFVLGTSPIFFLIGYITTRLSETLKSRFYQVAASLIFIVALTTIVGGINLTGFTLSSPESISSTAETVSSANPTITVSASGYTPNLIKVPLNKEITLTLVTTGSHSCANFFTIPTLNITQQLPLTGTTPIRFTATHVGPIRFTCGMGMYSGTIEVQPES